MNPYQECGSFYLHPSAHECHKKYSAVKNVDEGTASSKAEILFGKRPKATQAELEAEEVENVQKEAAQKQAAADKAEEEAIEKEIHDKWMEIMAYN